METNLRVAFLGKRDFSLRIEYNDATDIFVESPLDPTSAIKKNIRFYILMNFGYKSFQEQFKSTNCASALISQKPFS